MANNDICMAARCLVHHHEAHEPFTCASEVAVRMLKVRVQLQSSALTGHGATWAVFGSTGLVEAQLWLNVLA